MPVVTHLEALEILDNRGLPTLQAWCVIDGGVRGSAAIPTSTAPTNAEVLDLRDGDPARHRGQGCRKPAAHIEAEIRSALLNKRFADQATLDRALLALDGTESKSRFGGNALLAVSLAFARAHATARGLPLYQHLADILGQTANRLPRPMVHLFDGGARAGSEVNLPDLGIVPVAATMEETLTIAGEVQRAAAALIARTLQARTLPGEGGGLEAPFVDTEAMLQAAVEAITAAAREPGRDVFLTLGLGANRRFDSGWYRLDGEKLTADEIIWRLAGWSERLPLVSVKDALGDEDWEGWKALRRRLADRLLVLGDDLLSTSPVRIKHAVADEVANAVTIKPSQIGTVTEAADAVRLARQGGWSVVVAARDGETEDDWLADLAVGWGADQVDFGALTRSERIAKYNRLLAIEKRTRWPFARWPRRG